MRKASRGVVTFLLLIPIAFIFAMFQGGFVSWFLLFTLLFIAASTFLWYFVWFRGFTIERIILSKQAVAGDTLRVQLKIRNKWPWIPYAYLLIEDELHAKFLNNGKYSLVIYPWFKRELELEYQFPNLPRGVLRFKQLHAQTGDLFGFVHKQLRIEQLDQVLVYPKYEELTYWQTGKEDNQGRVHRQHHWVEDTAAIAGIRDYRSGDRLTRVHWKASARSLGLKTKEFEQALSDDFVFFLDRERKAYSVADERLFELGVTLTASLIRYTAKHSLSSGLISHGVNGLEVIPLSQRQDMVPRFFEHLARVEADSPVSFSDILLEQTNYVPRGATQVIISPQLTEAFVLLLTELSYRQKKLELFWLKGKWVKEENRGMATEEQRLLALLRKAGITYHIIVDNQFQQILARGGENPYASPTQTVF